MVAPGVRTVRFSEFDALASALRGGTVTLTPVAAGPFGAELTEFGLDDVLLQIGCSTPVMTFGEVAADAAWIQFPLGRHQGLLLNGRQACPGDFAVHAPGAGLDGVSPVDARWAVVVLPADTVAALLPSSRRGALLRPGTRTMLRANPPAWARAASLMNDATEVAAQDPGVFQGEEPRRSLRASVLDTLAELLAGPWEGPATRVLRTPQTRHRIVRAVEERLRAAPRHAARLPDLCAALGLPRPRVSAAFRATFAMNLQRYLRLRRLAMAHTTLRNGGGARPPSLAELAEALGFPDRERFTREYRELFGETPAETLGRLRAPAANAGGSDGGMSLVV